MCVRLIVRPSGRASTRKRWRQRSHERVEMPQHTASRRLRWSLLAAPVAGVLILAGCSGTSDGDSTSTPGADVGFSIMVAQANDADDFYAQTAEAYTKETGVADRGHPLPLRRLQHAGHHAAAGRKRRGRHDPVARNRPGDLGRHPRGGRTSSSRSTTPPQPSSPRAPKRCTKSTATSTASPRLSHLSDSSTTARALKRSASTSTRRPTTTCSQRARRRATAARRSRCSPDPPRPTPVCSHSSSPPRASTKRLRTGTSSELPAT